VDFDELLDEARFDCIEKIKTIGSTYMAVSGLNPTSNVNNGLTMTLTLILIQMFSLWTPGS
jgi:Adenylate and Guanylate cyclase catalytic domain